MDSLQLAHWLFSALIMTVGSSLLGIVIYWACAVELTLMHYAFIPMLISDLAIILNHWPRDIVQLFLGRLEVSPWCIASAYISVATCVAANFNALLIAYSTKQIISNNSVDRKLFFKKLIFISSCGWAVGVALSGAYLATGRLGPFKDLYCVTVLRHTFADAAPYFFIFLVCAALLVYYYYSTLQIVKQNQQAVSMLSPTGQKNGPVTALTRLGVYMVCSFYLCWAPVSVLALIEIFGGKYPRALDMVAAWCIKLQTTCDCIILLKAFHKLTTRKAFTSRARYTVVPHSTINFRRTSVEAADLAAIDQQGLLQTQHMRARLSPPPTFREVQLRPPPLVPKSSDEDNLIGFSNDLDKSIAGESGTSTGTTTHQSTPKAQGQSLMSPESKI